MEEKDASSRRKSRVSIAQVAGRKSTGGRSMQDFSRMRVRRQSYGFGGVAGIKPVERTSQIAMEFKRPVMMYLNTYQLESSRPFHEPMVTKATDAMLDEMYEGHKYNASLTPALALKMSGRIMRDVKAMGFNRYRIIAVVTIAQKRAQSYNNAVAFLWDHERDSYVNVQRENSSVFVQVTVFGVYFD